jgi:signal recognition particle subunit SRP19
MVTKADKKWVIWPCYFNRDLSRSQGRRVPKRIAIKEPTIELIAKAAKSLHLNSAIEQNACYPAQPWKHCGRVLINKKDKKEKSLKQLAEKLH